MSETISKFIGWLLNNNSSNDSSNESNPNPRPGSAWAGAFIGDNITACNEIKVDNKISSNDAIET